MVNVEETIVLVVRQGRQTVVQLAAGFYRRMAADAADAAPQAAGAGETADASRAAGTAEGETGSAPWSGVGGEGGVGGWPVVGSEAEFVDRAVAIATSVRPPTCHKATHKV